MAFDLSAVLDEANPCLSHLVGLVTSQHPVFVSIQNNFLRLVNFYSKKKAEIMKENWGASFPQQISKKSLIWVQFSSYMLLELFL